MKAWVIDTENNILNKGEGAVGDMKASPYHVDNHIVVMGEKKLGDEAVTVIHGPSYTFLRGDVPACLKYAINNKTLLIGQNIAHDLKYLAKDFPDEWLAARPNIYIWDTQQVAYLLSAQTHIYPSLDDLSKELGLEVKDEKIKEYWNAGVDTADIPIGQLVPYLKGDVNNTEAVFRYQYDIVSAIPSLFNLVRVKMDDILATNMMEMEGMHFDLVAAQRFIDGNIVKEAINRMHAQEMAAELFDSRIWFNPMSNDHISIAMFGGTYTITEDVVVTNPDGSPVLYKTGKRAGQPKTKRQDVEYTTEGFGLTPPPGSALKKRGFYSTSDEVLKQFATMDFVQHIMRIRELTKETETYYRGYSALVWPDGLIHPSINHCSTRTGRQSCTKPNLQNVTREKE